MRRPALVCGLSCSILALASPASALSLDAMPPLAGFDIQVDKEFSVYREGSGGNRRLVITIRRTLGLDRPGSVAYRIVPRSALPGVDFVAPLSGTIELLAGEETKDLAIEIVGDTDPECDEYFMVRFEVPGVSLLGQVVIEDDDRPRGGTGSPDGGTTPTVNDGGAIDAPYWAPFVCVSGVSVYTYPACNYEPVLTGPCPGAIPDWVFDAGPPADAPAGLPGPLSDAAPVTVDVGAALPTPGGSLPDSAAVDTSLGGGASADGGLRPTGKTGSSGCSISPVGSTAGGLPYLLAALGLALCRGLAWPRRRDRDRAAPVKAVRSWPCWTRSHDGCSARTRFAPATRCEASAARRFPERH
jgi:hypothetical protein